MAAKPIREDKKAENKGLDILNPVPHSNEPRAYSEGYDILAMIDGYENEGREILKAFGYPLSVREIIHNRFDKDGCPLGKKPLPRRVRDVMGMLEYFDTVRFYIKKNNILYALCFMAYGVQAAMKARIRPVEPLIEIGEKYRNTKKQIRAKRDTWHGATRKQIKERDQVIKSAFENWKQTANAFDTKYGKINNLSPSAIRKIRKS